MRFRFRALLSALVLAVTLAVSAVTAPACATLRTPAGQGEATQSARLQELSQLAAASKQVLLVIQRTQAFEITLHAEQVIPDAAHRDIQLGYLTFGRQAVEQLAIASDLARSDADRRAAVSAFLKGADGIIKSLEPHIAGEKATTLRTVVLAVRASLASLNLAV